MTKFHQFHQCFQRLVTLIVIKRWMPSAFCLFIKPLTTIRSQHSPEDPPGKSAPTSSGDKSVLIFIRIVKSFGNLQRFFPSRRPSPNRHCSQLSLGLWTDRVVIGRLGEGARCRIRPPSGHRPQLNSVKAAQQAARRQSCASRFPEKVQ